MLHLHSVRKLLTSMGIKDGLIRQPRNKPMPIMSGNIGQREQEYTMGKR